MELYVIRRPSAWANLQELQTTGAKSARIGNDSPDLMIASIALDRGLTVATRNIRHFEPTGVATLDPMA